MSTSFIIPLSHITAKNKTEVGIPTLELAELMTANVPIPIGFVITQAALETFAVKSQLDQKVKQLQQTNSFSEANLINLILESDLPEEIHNELKKEFSNLTGLSNIWLKIRAGLYDHSGNPLAYIDESEISEVRGFDPLEFEVKKIWAKLLIIDQKYDSLGSFIIIQKSIPAEIAGIIYTQDKLSNNSDHILIKSIYGEYTTKINDYCDTYTFSKSQEKIIDRAIVPQQKMNIRSNKNDFGYDEVEISEKWQRRQKLADKYVEDLGYLGDYLENVFTKPQEVSWIFQAGKIWINYVRPLTTQMEEAVEKEEEAISKDMNSLDVIAEKEAENFETESVDITLPETNISISTINNEENKNIQNIEISVETQQKDIEVRLTSVVKDVLVVGVGNNKGIIEGKVVLNREECTDKDILILTEWDNLPKNAAGVIVEDNLSGSASIPVIYGAELAAKILREGEYVRLDTDTGFVFEMQTAPKEINSSIELPVQAEKPEVKIEEDYTVQNEEEIIPPILEIEADPKILSEEDLPADLEVLNISTPSEIEKHHKIVSIKKSIKKIETDPTQVFVNEEIHTAIKVFAKISTAFKEDYPQTDGYFLSLPHAEDYFTMQGKIEYKSIHNLIFSFALPYLSTNKKSVIYSIYDINPAAYIKNVELLDVQCEAIHKLRSKENMRQLHIALPKFKNLKQLREFRKSLSSSGLRRSTTLKVYIKAAYSSNIFELSQYLEDKFDGVIVPVQTLYNSLYSSTKRFTRVTDTIISAISQMQKECKEAQVPLILDLSGIKVNKTMLEKFSQFINYATIVSPSNTIDTKMFIANLEKERIFK